MSEPLESCGLAILLTRVIMASKREPDAGDMRALHPLHYSSNPPHIPYGVLFAKQADKLF